MSGGSEATKESGRPSLAAVLGLDRGPWLSSEVLAPAHPRLDLLIDEARLLVEAGARVLFVPDAPLGRARIDSITAAAAVQRELGVPSIPHLNCRDRNALALDGALLAAAASGLRAVKAVTGDQGDAPVRAIYELRSGELVARVRQLAEREALPFAAVVGHRLGDEDDGIEAKGLERKVEAGAALVVATPTLDAHGLDALLARTSRLGVDVAASLTLVQSSEVLAALLEDETGFDAPPGLAAQLHGAEPEAALEAGLACALACAEALRGRVAGFHVVPPFGRAAAAVPLLRALG